MYDPNIISIPPGYGRIRFSKVEMKNILIAVSALTLAFTILFTLNPPVGGLSTVDSVLFALVASFVAVLTGFMLHEFAHKLVAQRSGAWAEFRAYPLGLVLAIMFSLMGFIFAAPGAVYIQGMVSRRQNGLISIAGPLTNMMLGLLFIGLALLLQGGVVAAALYLVGWINVLLAVFNLLPVPPLDGHKVLKWSVPVYIVAFGGSAALALLIYTGVIF